MQNNSLCRFEKIRESSHGKEKEHFPDFKILQFNHQHRVINNNNVIFRAKERLETRVIEIKFFCFS